MISSMHMANNPVSPNPLGQIRDDVLEQLGDAAKNTAKAVVSEPARILEQILGGSPQSSDQQGSDQVEQGQATAQQQQALLQQKQQASQAQDAAAYKLHQQRLQEEIAYHQQSKQKQAQEEQVKDQEEERDKQVVQLRREKEDEALWQQQIKSVQGSHESQQGKM